MDLAIFGGALRKHRPDRKACGFIPRLEATTGKEEERGAQDGNAGTPACWNLGTTTEQNHKKPTVFQVSFSRTISFDRKHKDSSPQWVSQSPTSISPKQSYLDSHPSFTGKDRKNITPRSRWLACYFRLHLKFHIRHKNSYIWHYSPLHFSFLFSSTFSWPKTDMTKRARSDVSWKAITSVQTALDHLLEAATMCWAKLTNKLLIFQTTPTTKCSN